MTRELSPKTGAALLRKAFQAKGATISHTEVLDLMAKLKGFEAWSHLQQATKEPKQPAVAATKKKQNKTSKEEASLGELLIAHFGLQGELPGYPRHSFTPGIEDSVYWHLALDCAEEGGVLDQEEMFYVGQAIPVTLPDGTDSAWNIEQNLTDRWGDLNFHLHNAKPGLEILQIDTPLFNKVLEMMPSGYEMSFFVRKDQKIGLLYEAEFCSQESEEHNGEEDKSLEPHAKVVSTLLAGLTKLQAKYPSVQFCVPDKSQVINDRPATWAFILPDTLSEQERLSLANDMYLM